MEDDTGAVPMAQDGHADTVPDLCIESPPVNLETVHAWLQQLRPADALAILRQPEMAYVAAHAFVGFRVNAEGYRNPIVRNRLAQEILRDDKLQELIRAVVDAAPVAPVPTEWKTPDSADAPPSVDLAAELRHEREQRKRDRASARAKVDEERKASETLRRELAGAQSALAEAIAERDVLRESLDRSTHRVARLERQVARLKSERDSLLKAMPSTDDRTAAQASLPVTGASPSSAARSPEQSGAGAEAAREPAWMPSVPALESGAYRLLSQDKVESALDVAEAALKESPRDIAALDIAVTAYRRLGKRDDAVVAARDLVLAAVDAADIERATKALLTLLKIDPQTGLISTVSKRYVLALRNSPQSKLGEIASIIATARAATPAVYRRFVRMIEEYVPAPIARLLLDDTSVIGPADALPLQTPEPTTPLSIIAAIDAGEEQTIDALRSELERLQGANRTDYDRIIEAITQAADGSYLNPLIRRTRGPIVIDASNAAWYDEANGVADRPRLSQILSLRTAVRTRGYFPIILIGDAPLPHTIDERNRFAKMTARHEIMLVSTGTDADEAILREARRLGAPVVTNDYMADWDPDDEVEKIRYIIPQSGPAYLLS